MHTMPNYSNMILMNSQSFYPSTLQLDLYISMHISIFHILCIHSPNHLLLTINNYNVYPVQPFIHSFMHALIHALIHSFIHSFNQVLYLLHLCDSSSLLGQSFLPSHSLVLDIQTDVDPHLN